MNTKPNVFVCLFVCLFACLMGINATFNNISVNRGSQFYWLRKPEDPEKTTDLSQVTDKLSKVHCIGFRENQWDNREWTIQRHGKYWVQDTERIHTKQKPQHRG